MTEVESRLAAYARSLEALLRVLSERPPSIGAYLQEATAQLFPRYGSEGHPSPYEVTVPLAVLVNRSGTGTVAIVPIRLYEQGECLASYVLSGTLADHVAPDFLEGLVSADGRWCYLGKNPLPTRRYPTFDLLPRLEGAL